MNYELAKKLKDAGFPQDWEKAGAFYDDSEEHQSWTVGDVDRFMPWKNNPDGSGYHTPGTIGCGCCSYPVGSNVNNFVRIPTLSELIEACGDNLSLLINCGNHWQVQGKYKEHELRGSTPEEAVASLYIKLHSNETRDTNM